MKKKFVTVLGIALLCLCLTGCSMLDYKEATELYDAQDYQAAHALFAQLGDYKDSVSKDKECKYVLGKQAMENEEWDSAIEYFTNLSHSDSEELLTFCSVEKEKHEKADYAFLADLEEAIVRRMEMNAKENTDYLTLVTTELAFVEQYYGAEFYDVDLQKLAVKYIDGLYGQKDALSLEDKWLLDIAWREGTVERYEALNSLYEQYDFMKDNSDFIGTYVAQLDRVKIELAGYKAIEEDVGKQIDELADNGGILKYKSPYLWTQMTNNTEYTFDLVYNLRLCDKNDITYKTTSTVLRDIKPGETYQVQFYVTSKEIRSLASYWYETYYENIRKH